MTVNACTDTLTHSHTPLSKVSTSPVVLNLLHKGQLLLKAYECTYHITELCSIAWFVNEMTPLAVASSDV